MQLDEEQRILSLTPDDVNDAIIAWVQDKFGIDKPPVLVEITKQYGQPNRAHAKVILP